MQFPKYIFGVLIFASPFFLPSQAEDAESKWTPTPPIAPEPFFGHGISLQMLESSYLSNDHKNKASLEPNEDNLTLRSLHKAVEWTKKQMAPDWGWGPDTPHTVLALSVADSAWFSSSSLEPQLIAKQFDLQLVLRLWKHRDTPITTGQLALNVMALVSLCRDPRAFYDKDLVALLEHREGEVDFEVAFACLASCNAGKHIRKSKIRRVLEIISDHTKIHSVDTISIGILALRCSERQRGTKMREYLNSAVETLLNQQKPDGSFVSNLHSTAIALQAMMASGLGDSWNATRAQQYVMSHQLADGSFGNLFDTNAVLPLLAGKTLLDVGGSTCNKGTDMDIDQIDDKVDAFELGTVMPPVPTSGSERQTPALPASDVKPLTDDNINMTYIIWVGDKPTMVFNLSFCVPRNTNFFDIMQMAAERDAHFEFSASKWAHGYYVHTLAGQKEKQVGFWFWLLYRLREPPVPGIRPDNKFVVADGVVELIPNDGDYILFWYHKI